jgi:anti-sigma factor RsiW
MSCDELLRRLTEYEDGLLPADLCQVLETHFRDCPPCAELRQDLEWLKGMCRQVPRPPMPEELRQRLRVLLRKHG